jgi:hypothetical protein
MQTESTVAKGLLHGIAHAQGMPVIITKQEKVKILY